MHGFELALAFDFLPGVKLGGTDEVGKARAFTADVALARLLVERVEFEQIVIIGSLREPGAFTHRSFKLCFHIGHDFDLRGEAILVD